MYGRGKADDLYSVALSGKDFDGFWRRRRRWTLRNAIRRSRAANKRQRRLARDAELLIPYAKTPGLKNGGGKALVLADLSGGNGLSRAAQYEITQIRLSHDDVVTVDVSARMASRDAPITVDREQVYDVVILLCQPETYARVLPLFRPEQLAGAYRIGLWVWETPLFPSDWTFALDIVHEIWTPSAFVAAAIQRGTDLPVTLRPHAVRAPEVVEEVTRSAFGVPEGAFLGLAIMDLRSCPTRKNPWAHVEAWQRAFGSDPDCVLLLKVRLGKKSRIVEGELREMIELAGNIRILEQDMSDSEIAGFQRLADVYLSLHRSEGYGLNIHEFLLLDVPVVATDWSANAEYGPGFANYHPVKYRLEPYRDWTGHFGDDSFQWATADVDDAARTLRKIAAQRAPAIAGAC
ncbi:hypothetical protein SAMN05216548_12130 [Faunimonas pinastri]|uniref:Uncharacterized protein n=1 Tax=Faunimonas pinastri TaxID=1855383 RepID=A0A1H9PNI2_9HYPH|nr:glycosyltransferase [Faunimonas pinastri]SER49385.1 hypothetical protein SAMN05216548_12130 [Faunimonas pinastri]